MKLGYSQNNNKNHLSFGTYRGKIEIPMQGNDFPAIGHMGRKKGVASWVLPMTIFGIIIFFDHLDHKETLCKVSDFNTHLQVFSLKWI